MIFSATDRIIRFLNKPMLEKRAAIKATLSDALFGERRNLYGMLTGKFAPPSVLSGQEKLFLSYRPDSDLTFGQHPELGQLSQKWIYDNVLNNAGDLTRFYNFIFNIKNILADGVPGDLAELGVYKGNSAASLAHYAREFGRQVVLFDTFEGFHRCDFVGIDGEKSMEFTDTSLDQVRQLVGQEAVRFVPGYFPKSIPTDIYDWRFCVVHIDCDLHEPAKAALEFFYPRLSPGGLLIIHDYANPCWPGIKKAVDTYCHSIPERPVLFGDKSGTAMIRKALS